MGRGEETRPQADAAFVPPVPEVPAEVDDDEPLELAVAVDSEEDEDDEELVDSLDFPDSAAFPASPVFAEPVVLWESVR